MSIKLDFRKYFKHRLERGDFLYKRNNNKLDFQIKKNNMVL